VHPTVAKIVRAAKLLRQTPAWQAAIRSPWVPAPGDEKSYRRLVREGHRELGIVMLADREHWLQTRFILDRIGSRTS
jgi:hypothetical protein